MIRSKSEKILFREPFDLRAATVLHRLTNELGVTEEEKALLTELLTSAGANPYLETGYTKNSDGCWRAESNASLQRVAETSEKLLGTLCRGMYTRFGVADLRLVSLVALCLQHGIVCPVLRAYAGRSGPKHSTMLGEVQDWLGDPTAADAAGVQAVDAGAHDKAAATADNVVKHMLRGLSLSRAMLACKGHAIHAAAPATDTTEQEIQTTGDTPMLAAESAWLELEAEMSCAFESLAVKFAEARRGSEMQVEEDGDDDDGFEEDPGVEYAEAFPSDEVHHSLPL